VTVGASRPGTLREESTGDPGAQLVQAYAVNAVPIVRQGATIATAAEQVRGQPFIEGEYVYVIDADGVLVKAIPLHRLLLASPTGTIDELAGEEVPVVLPETDREAAASTAIRTGKASLAVCDASGRFLGAVNGAALLSILRDEHLEDLHHMAGILSKSEAAKRALGESPARRALFRLPWLLIGLVGSAMTTYVMAGYEKALETHITVAFFVPAIVYLADAIGTQSEAVAVRSLSLSTGREARLLAGEIGTGVLLGGLLGATGFFGVWLGFGTVPLAAAVGLAIFAAGAVATSVGSFLPWAFSRVGYDPALGSGPVGTVIQDVLSLVIYFWIAQRLIFSAET
jgi:magnesium transporter